MGKYRLDYRLMIPDYSGPFNSSMFPAEPGPDRSRTFDTFAEMLEWREVTAKHLGYVFADWRVTQITETVLDWSE